MDHPLPTRAALKAHAKRLRQDLQDQNTPVSHSKALELVAHQWGARDWNTLSAQIDATDSVSWHPGQRVRGRYLGHAFAGVVKAAQSRQGGFWRLTVRFDDPIDVVTSPKFSAWRQQVNVTVNDDGHTPQKTSDGVPHLTLQA